MKFYMEVALLVKAQLKFVIQLTYTLQPWQSDVSTPGVLCFQITTMSW